MGTWYIDVVCCLNITFVTWLKPSLLNAHDFLCIWKSFICVYACQGCRKYTHTHIYMYVCVCICKSVWKLCVSTTGMWDKQQFWTTPSALQWKQNILMLCVVKNSFVSWPDPSLWTLFCACTWKSFIWVYKLRVVGSSHCVATEKAISVCHLNGNTQNAVPSLPLSNGKRIYWCCLLWKQHICFITKAPPPIGVAFFS